MSATSPRSVPRRSSLTWDATATRLLAVYHETCDRPATPASAMERRHGLMQGTLSEDAIRLIGPGGALPTDVERPLLALATHPQIGTPMFGAMRLGYRAVLSPAPTGTRGPTRRLGRGSRRERRPLSVSTRSSEIASAQGLELVAQLELMTEIRLPCS